MTDCTIGIHETGGLLIVTRLLCFTFAEPNVVAYARVFASLHNGASYATVLGELQFSRSMRGHIHQTDFFKTFYI